MRVFPPSNNNPSNPPTTVLPTYSPIKPWWQVSSRFLQTPLKTMIPPPQKLSKMAKVLDLNNVSNKSRCQIINWRIFWVKSRKHKILFFFSTSVLNNNQFNKVICWTSGPAALVWNRSCQGPEAPWFQLTEWSCLGFHSAPDVQLWLIIFELVPSFFVHTHYKSNILWEITKKA